MALLLAAIGLGTWDLGIVGLALLLSHRPHYHPRLRDCTCLLSPAGPVTYPGCPIHGGW